MTIQLGKPYNLYELMKKAEEGDPEAMFDVVAAIAIDNLDEDDPDGEIAEMGFRYLKQLAERDDFPNTLIMLAGRYEYGNGTPQDGQEAVRWDEKAVDTGILFGNECIGMMYFYGRGVEQDYEKAFEYFTKDDHRKSDCTLYALGEMYRLGLYVEQDLEGSNNYFEEIVYSDSKFAEFDSYYWRACYRLGVALHNGEGIQRDISKALELMEKARRIRKEREIMAEDITSEDIEREWIQLNRDMGRL